MKRKYLNLVITILLLLSGASNLQAAQVTNYSIAVELARAEKVDNLVKKVNDLYSFIEFYVYQTGDSNPTISEINAFTSLDIATWENFNGDSMSIDFNDAEIIFNDLFSTLPSTEVLNFFKNNPNLTSLSTFDADTFKLKRIYQADFNNYIRKIKELETNSEAKISTTAPTDITKTWYKPDGKGGLDIYRYNPTTGEWVFYGNTSLGNSENNKIIVKSIEELESLPANTGMSVILSEEGIATEYIYDGDGWAKANSGLSEDSLKTVQLISGETISIEKLTDRVDNVEDQYFTFARGSNVIIPQLKGQSNIRFNKGNGYWESDITTPLTGNKKAFVAESIDDLISKNLGNNGDYAWIINVNGLDYKSSDRFVGDSDHYEAIRIDGQWQFSVSTLEALIDNFTKSLVIYDTTSMRVNVEETASITSAVYEYVPPSTTVYGYFRTTDNKIAVTEGDRSDLSIPSSSTRINLSASFGDDPAYTSTGLDSIYTYQSAKFKQWFYAASGTITNNLLDGKYGKDYYNNAGAGYNLVNPTTGLRFDNGQQWGTYYTYRGASARNDSHWWYCGYSGNPSFNPSVKVTCAYGGCGAGRTYWGGSGFTNPWGWSGTTPNAQCRSAVTNWY